jgi:hypothetical protein
MGPALRRTGVCPSTAFLPDSTRTLHAARCPAFSSRYDVPMFSPNLWAMSPCTRGTHIQKAIADSVVFRAARGLQCRVCAARSRALWRHADRTDWRAPETRLAGKPASPVASPPAPAL